MIWPITLGEMCVGSMQHVLLRGRVWFHLSNAFRSGTLEIALILVMCLIDLACRSVEATCSLEQQTEQFDVWIQLLSLPCILLADVTQCLCLSGSVHLSVKWWNSSSLSEEHHLVFEIQQWMCSFKGRHSSLPQFKCRKLPGTRTSLWRRENMQPSSWRLLGIWCRAEGWVAWELLSFCQEIIPQRVFY